MGILDVHNVVQRMTLQAIPRLLAVLVGVLEDLVEDSADLEGSEDSADLEGSRDSVVGNLVNSVNVNLVSANVNSANAVDLVNLSDESVMNKNSTITICSLTNPRAYYVPGK